jgi:signal peptidase I
MIAQQNHQVQETALVAPPAPGKIRRRVTVFTLLLLLVLALMLFVKTHFRSIQVNGNSMEPTFHTGQRLFSCDSYWLVGAIGKGDIVVVQREAGGEFIIKRVYALAGEKVDLLNLPSDYPLSAGDYVVPPGCVYILGDNKPVSEDSRRFGPIKVEDIKGKVLPWP